METQHNLSRAVPSASGEEATGAEAVLARVPAEQHQTINIRLVRGTRFVELFPRACRPRGDRPQTGFDRPPVAQLSSAVIGKLRDSNDRVMSWLAASEANARSFLENPAAALKEAGVDLTRADEKAIVRAREDLSGATVLPPGTDLTGLTVKAFPKGEVGKIDKVPGRRPGAAKRGCVRE
jgi:hypothetical protein